MRTSFCIFISIIFISCGGIVNTEKKSITESNHKVDTTNKDSSIIRTDTIDLLNFSNKVINSIKTKDVEKLANCIYSKGVRLSPYGYINVKTDKILQADELIDRYNSQNEYLWGYYDGSGDEIKLTCKQYFNKFVYDVDFEKESQISINKCKVKGNSLNNLSEIYIGLEYIEYYYSGTKKNDYMDWKALRLVYKRENGQIYLVGIIHDEWTI